MRTTLDIADDVLAAAKELARIQNVSAGRVVSDLAREALAGKQQQGRKGSDKSSGVGGFRPFPARGTVVSNDQINDLRDQEGV